MAFTGNSDLFGSINEEGINRAVRHIMRKRPSLFNYGTSLLAKRTVLFCAQLTKAEIDFHPNNVIGLPPELRPLGPQRFAFHIQVCGGIGCPSRDFINRITLPTNDDDTSVNVPGVTGKPTDNDQTRPNPDRFSKQM